MNGTTPTLHFLFSCIPNSYFYSTSPQQITAINPTPTHHLHHPTPLHIPSHLPSLSLSHDVTPPPTLSPIAFSDASGAHVSDEYEGLISHKYKYNISELYELRGASTVAPTPALSSAREPSSPSATTAARPGLRHKWRRTGFGPRRPGTDPPESTGTNFIMRVNEGGTIIPRVNLQSRNHMGCLGP